MTRKLNSVDSIFFRMESNDTPMHVAGLQIFQLPEDAPDDFVQKLVANLRRPTQLADPWNLKLEQTPLGGTWVTDHDVDMDYHVRHVALPRPGGERELGMMVSRLHSHCLRRHRPLWECYVIEGLEGNRFALYTKVHHALADGVSTIRVLTSFLSDSPDIQTPAPWAASSHTDKPTQLPSQGVFDTLREQVTALPDLSKALGRMLKQAVGGKSELVLPFSAPRSVLNMRITGQRRYATQRVEIDRIKAVGKATGTTLNDVVLGLCGAALRRFLKEANALPDKPLVAAVPVSVREPGDTTSSNAVSIMFATLGTHIADPLERLATIRASAVEGKAHLRAISKSGQQLYNSVLLTPFVLQVVTGIGARSHPVFNVTVSNVPGPSRPLYLQGAQMEAVYPVSIAAHGQAVNITCTSYNGSLNFGICGCRDALPHLQRMAVYAGEALTELEDVLGIGAKSKQRNQRKQSAA